MNLVILMSIFKRKPRDVLAENKGGEAISMVVTGENSWRIVYADKKAGSHRARAEARKAIAENVTGPYRIYFNR